MIALSLFGIVAGVALIIVLVYKGKPVYIAAFIAGLIMVLCNGMGWDDFISNYQTGYANTIGVIFVLYTASIIFNEVMMETGCTQSIANWLSNAFGAEHVGMCVVIGTLILSLGGLSNGAYITMYFVGMIMCEKANYDRSILAAAAMSSAWGFANTLPMVPNNANGVLNGWLGTNAFAGLVPGLVGSAVGLVLCIIYCEWVPRRLKKQGIGFHSYEAMPEVSENENLPSLLNALSPIILALVLYNVAKFNVINSLFCAMALCVALNFKRLQNKGKGYAWTVFTNGFKTAIFTVATIASISALGTIISGSPAFQALLAIVSASSASPYLITFVFAEVVGAALGTSSGTVNTLIPIMAPMFQNYVAQGYNMGNLHRILAFGSMGTSCLPQSGGCNGAFAMYKTTHKESYGHVFVTCVIIPIIAGIVALVLMYMGLK